MHTHMRMHTHMHMRMHNNTHTHMHMHMHMHMSSAPPRSPHNRAPPSWPRAPQLEPAAAAPF